MTAEETNRRRAAARCIDQTEEDLGPLSRSERGDLLLEAFRWVRSRKHAEWILAAVKDKYPILRSQRSKFD